MKNIIRKPYFVEQVDQSFDSHIQPLLRYHSAALKGASANLICCTNGCFPNLAAFQWHALTKRGKV